MTATLLDHIEPETAAAVARAEEVQELLAVQMRDAIARQRAAEVDVLVTAAAWADATAYVEPTCGAPGFDSPLVIAGAGAPVVSGFGVSELAALMGVTYETAFALLGDAIELKHRLPQLWALTTQAGTVSARLARQISELTRDLSMDAARDADQRLCRSRRRIDRRRARMVIDETRLWHDPDRAVDDEQQDLARRCVQIYRRPSQHHTPAVSEMYLLLDALEAERFYTALNHVAVRLGELGDTDPLDLRRAKAVGVLADPQTALDLLTGADDHPPATPAPPATLYLHLSDAALLEDGPVAIERLGTATKDLIRDWLADSRVIVRPVLRTDRADPIDRHDPPDWMREQVILRDRHCVFPHCNRDARFCDLDHIDPYLPVDEGGPPGQTHPRNLAPLCRRHHRAKTHAHFTYQRRPDGSYHWTLPTGAQLTVTP